MFNSKTVLTQNVENFLEISDRRIANGSSAKNGQFPYFISMRNNEHKHFCGGFMITPSWLGSAAHCLEKYPVLFIYVVAGSAILDEGYAERLEKIYMHPEFKSPTLIHDIGLMKTLNPIPEDDNTKRIYLGTDIVIGAKSVYSGYGVFSAKPLIRPRVLQYISSKVIDNESCWKKMGKGWHKNHTICTVTKKYSGSCQGEF